MQPNNPLAQLHHERIISLESDLNRLLNKYNTPTAARIQERLQVIGILKSHIQQGYLSNDQITQIDALISNYQAFTNVLESILTLAPIVLEGNLEITIFEFVLNLDSAQLSGNAAKILNDLRRAISEQKENSPVVNVSTVAESILNHDIQSHLLPPLTILRDRLNIAVKYGFATYVQKVQQQAGQTLSSGDQTITMMDVLDSLVTYLSFYVVLIASDLGLNIAIDDLVKSFPSIQPVLVATQVAHTLTEIKPDTIAAVHTTALNALHALATAPDHVQKLLEIQVQGPVNISAIKQMLIDPNYAMVGGLIAPEYQNSGEEETDDESQHAIIILANETSDAGASLLFEKLQGYIENPGQIQDSRGGLRLTVNLVKVALAELASERRVSALIVRLEDQDEMDDTGKVEVIIAYPKHSAEG